MIRMELEVAKKLIKEYTRNHGDFVNRVEIAERYYRKENDIKFQDVKKDKDAEAENPLRISDNRIPSNFYKLLVNQKASYAFTEKVTFDTGNKSLNELISGTLGDSFQKKCKSLCVQAANASVAWLHYWKNENGEFRYSVIDAKQIIPVWTKDLERELLAVLRTYTMIDDGDGNTYIVYEFWTDKESQAFRRRIDSDIDSLDYYNEYLVVDVDTGAEEYVSTYPHDFGEVPFIFFNNNDEGSDDLRDIKELIDAYDKVFSGFLNDLEDIQELIFIITNYGGDASESAQILHEMKTKKIINVESEGPDDKSGVSTLAIEIPVEARKEMLQITRKSIFEQGMGIDPDPQNFGNSSGVALGYLYSLLELKTGLMETEFRLSFNRLVRAILKFNGRTSDKLEQTWTRTSVTNDVELADIAQKSKNIISDETIVRKHPWVDDAELEIKRMEKQKAASGPSWDTAPPVKAGDGDGEEQGILGKEKR